MNNSVSIQQENTYWEMLKDLSSDIKLRLIARLSESLLYSSQDTKEQTLQTIDHSFAQLKEIKEGKMEGILAESIIDELWHYNHARL